MRRLRCALLPKMVWVCCDLRACTMYVSEYVCGMAACVMTHRNDLDDYLHLTLFLTGRRRGAPSVVS